MAEVVGLVASINQIAMLGVKLSTTLDDFAETVLGADKSLEDTATEVKLTYEVLEQLVSILEKFKKHGFASGSAIMTVEKLVHACSEDFNQINAILEKAEAARKKSKWKWLIFKSSQWPREKKKLEHQRSNLEKHKSTLLMWFGVLQLGLDLQYEAPFSYNST